MPVSARTSFKHEPGPAWDIARLFPDQGSWEEEDYLALETNHLVELADGYVEVLPMPTMSHQEIVQYLSHLLMSFVMSRRLGKVLFAPFRIRLKKGKYREPDVVFMLAAHADRMGEAFWRGADLVMEVTSPDQESRHRDLVTKRREYAQAGIPEYWIVDAQTRQISVLRLRGKSYSVHGRYGHGERAQSALLDGFEVAVDATFESNAME